MSNLLIGAFLIGHGLVHWVYIAPEPNVPEAELWSFMTNRWLVTKAGVDQRFALMLGIVLMGLITVGFAASGIGLIVSWEAWRILAIGSAVVSLLLLGLFWHNWMIAGPVLNLGIILLALYWGR